MSHRYYWTRFELSWLSSAVGNRCDRPTPCSFFIQKLKSRAGRVNQHWKGSAAQYINASTSFVLIYWAAEPFQSTLALVLCWYTELQNLFNADVYFLLMWNRLETEIMFLRAYWAHWTQGWHMRTNQHQFPTIVRSKPEPQCCWWQHRDSNPDLLVSVP